MSFYPISNSSSLFAQETFFSIFSSNDIERGTSLLITSDNHLMIVGTSMDASTGNTQIIVIKTDNKGKTLWTKKYGDLINPKANVGIVERADSQYILAATTHQALNAGDVTLKNAYVFSIDKNGNVLWEKVFGSIFKEEVMDMSNEPISEWTMIGMTALVSYQGPYPTAATFWLDSLGNPYTSNPNSFPWTIFFQGNNSYLDMPFFYNINSFIKDERRNFIRIGTTYAPLKPENIDAFIWGSDDYVVMGGEEDDILYRGIGLPSTQYANLLINVGYSTSYGNGSKDIYISVVKDSSSWSGFTIPLKEKHTKTFSTPNHEVATDIFFADTHKEHFIVAGYMEQSSASIPTSQDVFLMKIDSNANILWTKVYPQPHDQMPATTTSSLSIAENGDIFLIGTQKEDDLRSSIFLLKTNRDGALADCGSTDIFFSIEAIEGDFQSYLQTFDNPQQVNSSGILTKEIGITSPINICLESEVVCGITHFSLDTITIDIGEQASLNTYNAISYQWSPTQSLNNPFLQDPIANPLENTLYQVTLTDVNGCTSTDVIFVEVLPIPLQIAIPSAFTPNQDGYNDVFQITGKGFEFLQLTIYNRWGKKVFETTDRLQSWDGTVDFEPQPLGVYTYSLQYQTIGSETLEEKTGFVSLLY